MNILSTRGVLEQGACLDALIAIMLDSSSNQMVMFYFFIADSESMNRCPTFLCCYMSSVLKSNHFIYLQVHINFVYSIHLLLVMHSLE